MKENNRSDRSRRDEPLSEIKKQILDAAPELAKPKASKDRDEEFQQDQVRGQVPGHLGYNTTDNLLNVNPETEKF